MSIGLGFDQYGNACTCYNATDCNNAIANESCSVIKLGADINGQIVFNGVSNKILDGQRHTIFYSSWVGAIELNGTNTNLTIKNCDINGSYVGIVFYGTDTNVTVKDCYVNGSYSGIWFFYVSTNTNITIENCNISGFWGVWLAGMNTNIKITDCIISEFNDDKILGNSIKFDGINVNIIIERNSLYGSIEFSERRKNTNILIYDCTIVGFNGIEFMWDSTNTNISIIRNKFNVSDNFISLEGGTSINNLVLNDSCCGNYYGRPDGTGYSDICNDTNNDGICDQPFNPVTVKFVSFELKIPETKTLKKLKLEENKY